MENTIEMRLTPLLTKVILKEVSQKLKKELITKFKQQTNDNEKTIDAIINGFEKYKEGLDTDKRDITRYSYDDLKSLVVGKEMEKSVSATLTQLKKSWDAKKESLPDEQKGPYRYESSVLKNLLTKFYDIYPFISEKERDIKNYDYLSLTEFINKNYAKIMNKVISDKMSKDQDFVQAGSNPDTLLFYTQAFIQNRARVPRGTKPIYFMTFHELEQLVDGYLSEGDENAEKYKEDLSGIDIVYDKNNLLVFAPKTKDQCVKLKNGRSWCTSREGGGNLYYNYRLNNERTLYYVIDQDKPFKDLNYAVVILVDPDGRKSLADGSNSGKYSGHQNIPWSEISDKLPKLANLESLFVPKPLTQEERQLIKKVTGVRVGDNPYDTLGDEQSVEMWLEYNSPKLNDAQFENLSTELQKKYISLGFDLTGSQLRVASESVLNYYINKKKEKLANTSFDKLSADDIELLSLPMMKRLKESLKEKFAVSLVTGTGDNKSIDIKFPESPTAKFIALYGFDDFFNLLPKDIVRLEISGTANKAFPIPSTISELENLQGILIEGLVSEVPDEICKLNNLKYLSLQNSTSLKSLPDCMANMKNLRLMSIRGCPNIVLSDNLKSKIKIYDSN